MNRLRAWLVRLLGTFNRRPAETSFNDELASHLELHVEEGVRSGLPREEARRRAVLALGGVEQTRERYRDRSGWPFLESLIKDVRFGLRMLIRHPGFTAVAILTLALGIGANTAMFTVVNAVLLRPLPYPNGDRLVMIWSDDRQRGLHQEATAVQTIEDWRAQTRAFESLAYFSAERATLNHDGDRERTRRTFVSANLFATLGVQPALGRAITDGDEQSASRVAVISHALWIRRFNGDAAAIGRTFYLEDAGRGAGPLEVIGVMPRDFYFPDKGTEIWTPATTYWRFVREKSERFPSWARRWTAVGRLDAGRSIENARVDLAQVGDHLTRVYPTTEPDFPGFGVTVMPVLQQITGSSLPASLWTLFGAVTLVLLVSCANIANLLLARGTSRRQEFAIRRAIGASRVHLARQLIVESTVLALAGGALAIGLALVSTRVLTAMSAGILPRLDEVAVDGRVLLFALGVSILSGLAFGIAPAARLSAGDPGRSLLAGMRGTAAPATRRLRASLVFAECTLAVLLLAGAGLLLRSLVRLHDVNPGFDPAGVVTMRIEFPPEATTAAAQEAAEAAGPARAQAREQLLSLLIARIGELPQVERAGVIDDLFLASPGNESITIPGRSPDSIPAGELVEGTASPGVFEALRVPLRRGRYLQREDALRKIGALWTPAPPSSAGVLEDRGRQAVAEPVIVNDAFVRRFFSGIDPIGQRFCIDPDTKTYWYEIVGVIGDMHRHGLAKAAIPQYYGPLLPAANARADLLVRTKGDPMRLETDLIRVVKDTMPGTLVASVSGADRLLAGLSAERDLQTWLLTVFASLALVLAAVGIYGVVHYTVTERTREIGVRLALGASAGSVIRLVIRDGLRAPLFGIALGLAIAVLAARLVSHLMFGISVTDPITYAGAAAVLAFAAATACLVPALRATRVDPIATLRD